MAEPQTVNGGLIVPNTGDLVGTWGSAALNPDFVAVDGFLCGVQTVSASSVPITLTSPAGFTPTPGGGPTQAQNAVLRFTGAISAGISVTLPLPGYYIIENLTTGAFILQFRAIGVGQLICVDQGEIQHIYNDGTNVRFVNLGRIGSYLDICDASVPPWISNCTVPPYLLCDGSTFSAVTYPYLNVKLGGTTLPDYRGRNSFYLNGGTGRLTSAGAGIDGNTRFATGGNNGITAGLMPGITVAGTLSVTVGTNPPNVPASTAGVSDLTAQIQGGVTNIPTSASGFVNVTSWTGSATGTLTSSNTLGLGTTMQNATPGIVGGIRLIRAA